MKEKVRNDIDDVSDKKSKSKKIIKFFPPSYRRREASVLVVVRSLFRFFVKDAEERNRRNGERQCEKS